MSGQVLRIVEQHSYLGVIIDHQLSWKPHVEYVCGKAMKLIGFLNRNLNNYIQVYLLKRIERIKLQAICVTSIRLCFIYLGSLPSKSNKQT